MTINYKDKTLHFDDQNILDIVAKHQTPFYIYSENIIKNNFNLYHESFGKTQHTTVLEYLQIPFLTLTDVIVY